MVRYVLLQKLTNATSFLEIDIDHDSYLMQYPYLT